MKHHFKVVLASLCLLLFACQKQISTSDNGPIQDSNAALGVMPPYTTWPYYAEIKKDKTEGLYSDTCRAAQGAAYGFVGNSYINNYVWYGFYSYAFRGKQVLNRAFGGSRWHSIPRWVPYVIDPYKFKTLFLYEGTNELSTQERTKEQIVNHFLDVMKAIRVNNPTMPIGIISLLKCPKHQPYFSAIDYINSRYKEYISTDPYAFYIDMQKSVTGATGKIWKTDGIHPDVDQYKIWTTVLKTYMN